MISEFFSNINDSMVLLFYGLRMTSGIGPYPVKDEVAHPDIRNSDLKWRFHPGTVHPFLFLAELKNA